MLCHLIPHECTASESVTLPSPHTSIFPLNKRHDSSHFLLHLRAPLFAHSFGLWRSSGNIILYLGLLVRSVDLLAMVTVVDVCIVMRPDGTGTG